MTGEDSGLLSTSRAPRGFASQTKAMETSQPSHRRKAPAQQGAALHHSTIGAATVRAVFDTVLHPVLETDSTHGQRPATRNRTRDHLIAAVLYSQMLYQLSYSRLATSRRLQPVIRFACLRESSQASALGIFLVQWQ